MPPNINPTPQDNPDAEARIVQAHQHQQSTEHLLETIINQNEKNNTEPLLEHMLVKSSETVAELKKIAEPLATVQQFMDLFVKTVQKVKGDKGDTPEVDYEKVVGEAVPKVQQALKNDMDAMPDTIAEKLSDDKEFIEKIKPAAPDIHEVAHALKENPFFIEMVKGEPGDDGEMEDPEYQRIVDILKSDADFVALCKGEPGVSNVVVKQAKKDSVLDARTISKMIAELKDDDRISYNALKDTPNLDVFRRQSTKDYAIRDLTDVSMQGIVVGQLLQWDGTRFIPYTISASGSTQVFGENLTPQGPGTAFTLAHTPLAGTVRLYRGGAYQQAGGGNDYTISGAIITLATTLVAGEILLADYNY